MEKEGSEDRTTEGGGPCSGVTGDVGLIKIDGGRDREK